MAKRAEPKPARPSKAAAAKPVAAKPAPKKPAAKKPAAKKPPRARKPAAKKPAPKKTPKVKSGHAPTKKELDVIRRRNKVLDLRTNGASIRQISELLSAQGEEGCSPTRIHQLLVEALEDMHKHQRMKVRHYQQLELNKIDRAELAIFPRLLKVADMDTLVDADGIEKLSRSIDRLWKRRDALLGLHKPQEIKVDARETLARLLGRKPEDLPDGDPDA